MIQFRSPYIITRHRMVDREIRCDRVRELLTDFIEGELHETEQSLMDAHLAGCRPCRQVYDELLLTISLLNRLPKHTPRPNTDTEFDAL